RESYPQFGADPMYMFQNGGLKLSRNIIFARALGRELRRRGMYLDGIWSDNEGQPNIWNLSTAQITAIIADPRARAKAPPGVNNLTPEMFVWGNPNYFNAVATFNNYAALLWSRSLRAVLV